MKKFKKLVTVMLAAIMIMAMGTSVFAANTQETSDSDGYYTTITYDSGDTEYTDNYIAEIVYTYSDSARTILTKTEITYTSSGTYDSAIITYDSDGNATTVYYVNAEAVKTEYTITLKTTDTSSEVVHTYYAYQIFKGTLSANGDTLSDIQWGDGITDGAALITALTGITDSSDALYGLFNATTVDSADDVAAVYTKITESQRQAFIDYLVDNGYLQSPTSSTASADRSTYTISGLEAGYYLVMDSSLTSSTGTAYTSYILQLVKSLTMNVKETAPTIDKTIVDSNDTEIGTTNTAAVGDTITFKITATVPDVTGYDEYTYKITDTLSSGLTYDDNTSNLTVKIGSSGTVLTKGANKDYTVAVSTANSDGEVTITINFVDFLETIKGYSAGDEIVVTYTVTLTGDTNDSGTDVTSADTGNNAFTNKVQLEYSNNPNADGTAKTVEEKTYTYTTSLTVTKTYDGTDASTAIDNTEFTLYIQDSNGSYTFDGNTYSVVGTAKPTGSGSYTLSFVGLEAGTYRLVETTVPDGYNKSEDITFTIGLSGTGENATWEETSGSAVTVNSAGNCEVTVANYKGSTIPVTGGMGTTILYIIGAILVIGAAVLLVTRRRMSNK